MLSNKIIQVLITIPFSIFPAGCNPTDGIYDRNDNKLRAAVALHLRNKGERMEQTFSIKLYDEYSWWTKFAPQSRNTDTT